MGMYDSIIIDNLYCPFCGKPIENSEWQTKASDCVLKTYHGLTEFGDDNYKLYYYNIYTTCGSCGELVDIEVRNNSPEHRVYADRQLKVMKDDLTKRCTTDHPNHAVHGNNGYKPYFWNCWCSICKEKEYASDEPNPDMDPTYLKVHQDRAKQDYLRNMKVEDRAAFEKMVNDQGWEVAVKIRRKKVLTKLARSGKINEHHKA